MQRRMLWIIIVLLLMLAGCGGDENNTTQQEDNSASTPADLTIASIEIDPAQPRAGQPFTIRVAIRNRGGTESGAFSVTVALRDVTRNRQLPVGTFAGAPVKGGAAITVYDGEYHGLTNPGSYQVQVQIGYNADANADNNQQNKAFTVGR